MYDLLIIVLELIDFKMAKIIKINVLKINDREKYKNLWNGRVKYYFKKIFKILCGLLKKW